MDCTVLREMYGGFLHPGEKIFCRLPEYKRLNDEVCGLAEKIEALLPEEERGEVQRLLETHTAAESLQEEENFLYGFSLGAKLMMEIFSLR